jgi:RimJ/RimL family protein N-acetyltransferase
MSYAIREINIEDAEFVNALRNSCIEYLHTRKIYTLEETEKWLENLKYPWFIIYNDKERCGYFRIDKIHDKLYIGMDILPLYRNQGIGTELYRQFLPEILKYFEVDEIYLEVLEMNYRAIKVYEKVGFKYDGYSWHSFEDGTKIKSLHFKFKLEWFNIR